MRANSSASYSLYRDLDPDLRGLPVLKAINLQRRLNRVRGEPDPPSLRYAQRANEVRTLHKIIEQKNLPSFKRDVPIDPGFRIFIPESEYHQFGRSTKQLISKLTRGIDPGKDLTGDLDDELTVKDYFAMLLRNRKISDFFKTLLIDLDHGNTNQGPGLGPTNERRAALALSIIKDRGFISGFRILGEAGRPLRLKRDVIKANSLNYSTHEETMAVDLLIHLSSPTSDNLYLPIQIKSAGGEGYDEAERYLSFNAEEKHRIEKVIPATRAMFVRDTSSFDEKYLLKIKRRVLKMSLNNRKIVKNHRKDYEQDIVNKILTMIEYARGDGSILLTNRPYEKYPFVDRVLLMIKSGFITPVTDTGI